MPLIPQQSLVTVSSFDLATASTKLTIKLAALGPVRMISLASAVRGTIVELIAVVESAEAPGR